MLPLIDPCCPCCGETIALAIDDSAGEQAYVEDCHVCCRPIEIAVRCLRTVASAHELPVAVRGIVSCG